jgi:putative ABC transport system permease protein
MLRNIFLVSVRNFLRNPGTSLLNVLGLGVGFTCMLLTILWVATEFSFNRFHHEPDNLYKVMTHVESDGSFTTFDAAAAGIDVSSIPEIESVVTVVTGKRWPNELCFRKEGNTTDCVYQNGIFATNTFFSTFDFPLVNGEAQPLKDPSTIAISEKMATLLYGTGDPIGKTINIDDRFPVTVTAVFKDVPANSSLQFQFVGNMAVLRAMRGLKDQERYAEQFYQTYIRTNQKIETAVLTSKLNDSRVLSEKLKADKLSYEAFPLENWRLKNKFEDGKVAGGRIDYIKIFLVITALVVILAVINFVNVSTARATIRAKEIGIRKVTGALRSNIILQFIGESFMIVLLSFAIAAGLTQLILPFFGKLIEVAISVSLLSGWFPLYSIALLILISILAGFYPAFVMAAFQPITVLKNQVSGLHGSNRLRKVLLVVQLSISLGILSFSGVLFLQLKYMSEKDLGIDHQNIIHVEPTYRMLQKFDAFKNELAKNGVIVQTAAASSNPLDMQSQNTGVSWPGKPVDERVSFQVMGCSYEFLETFNLKLLKGRNFQAQAQDTINSEIIVSEDGAEMMGMKDPVGAVIKIGDASCVIIGVVNNFHTRPLHEERLPVILYRSQYTNLSYVYVKYQSGKTAEAMRAVESAYKTVEPSYTMKYWFQDERFDEQYKTEKVASTLVSFFSTIALIIACIGIVGLATFNVLRRLKEMSIRKVFGASGIQLMKLLTSEFGWIMIIAMVIGTSLVWYAADEWLNGFAFHISIPWALFALCGAVLCLLTILIVVGQGMKAIVSNPTTILRND